MELSEAIELIQGVIPDKKNDENGGEQVWTDLGCGKGLFSHALASLLPRGSTVYAVDRVLPVPALSGDFNRVTIKEVQFDFERDPLDLPELDGILMANSLHYIKDKSALLGRLISCMKREGHFGIVEYNTETPNRWVPFPVSYPSLQQLFREAGFTTRKLHERDSRYNRAKMYSALAER